MFFSLELNDLLGETSYSGFVTAKDFENNSVKVPFTFNSIINSAPDSFKITVSKITYDQALIEWVRAIDKDKDSISYSIKLNGIDVATQITNQYSFECKNLLPETHYEGVVIATDSKSNSKALPFRFSTPKRFLRFNKMLSIEGYNITGYTIDKTNDGGYVIGCDGLKSPQWNYVAIKIDSLANIEWHTMIPLNYPGMGVGEVKIRQTTDNGYLMLSQKKLIKLNSTGKLVWQYTQAQALTDPGVGFASFIQTPDNGYLAIGSVYGDAPTKIQTYIAKFNEDGVIQWEKSMGSAYRNFGYYIEKTDDGNYVILGTSGTDNIAELTVTKIDGNGNLIWNRLYPNAEYIYDFAKQIKKTNDNGFIITGYSWDYYHVSSGRLLKIDKDGNLIWEKYFNWDGFETTPMGVDPTKDSGFAIAGIIGYSPQGCIFAKVDADGNLIWNRNLFSGTGCSFQGRDIKTTYDGGFIVIGTKGCIWGDDGNEHGLSIFKSDPDGNYEI